MAVHTGKHFLQIPGPTNVPDRVLRRWTCLPSIIAAPISRNWDWMSSRVARPSSVPHRAGGVLAAMEVLKGKDAIPLSTRQSVVA
jgi:hypothetical protein